MKQIILNQLYQRRRICDCLCLNLWSRYTGKELRHSGTWVIFQGHFSWLFSHNNFFNKISMWFPYNWKARRCLGRSRFFFWSCRWFQVLQKFSYSLCVAPPASSINLHIDGDQITCSRSSLHTRETEQQLSSSKEQWICTVTKIWTKRINESKRKI